MVCEHRRNGEWKLRLTGNKIEGCNEYECTLCGILHIASKEEEANNTFYLGKLSMDDMIAIDKREFMKKAFEMMFGEKIEMYHRVIRRAGGSAQINVPKKFAFCPATVICWVKEKDPEKYGQTKGRGLAKLRQGPFAFHPVYSDPSYRTRGELLKEVDLLKEELKKLNPDHSFLTEGVHVKIQETDTAKAEHKPSESPTVTSAPSPEQPDTSGDLRVSGLEERKQD